MKNNFKTFPLLLLTVIFLSLLVVLGINSNQKAVINSRAQNQKETALLPGSGWVPIKLAEYNLQNDKNVSEAKSLLNQVKNDLALQKADKNFKIDLYQRALKIYQIEKEEYNLMDENKDGEIDYSEFNQGIVMVYERTYSLKHIKRADKPDGLYDKNWNPVTSKNLKKVTEQRFASQTSVVNNLLVVVVEAGIYDQLTDSLNQYSIDVNGEGLYQVQFYLCNNCTKENIKQVLRLPRVAGTLLVGELPVAWFHTPAVDSIPAESFPIDLYFMDLNGSWGEETQCNPEFCSVRCPREILCFTSHSGPEHEGDADIFFGRLTPPDYARRITLLANYFRKNHKYRSVGSSLPFRALNYLDFSSEEDEGRAPGHNAQDIAKMTVKEGLVFDSIVHQVAPPSYVSPDSYSSGLNNRYSYLILRAHSSPSSHTIGDQSFGWERVRDQKPPINFYQLNACSASQFTVTNYIGGWYLFQESDYGLAVVGSTDEGGAADMSFFHETLSRQEDIGNAFKAQFETYLRSPRSEFLQYGKTLLGDPTLKIISPVCPLPDGGLGIKVADECLIPTSTPIPEVPSGIPTSVPSPIPSPPISSSCSSCPQGGAFNNCDWCISENDCSSSLLANKQMIDGAGYCAGGGHVGQRDGNIRCCGCTCRWNPTPNPGSNPPGCNPNQVSMSFTPVNPVSGNSVSFSVSGSQGSTYMEDVFSGGVDCANNGFWGNKTCTAISSGTYTWTHYWKNCAPNDCGVTSSRCSKNLLYTIVNPTPTITLIPTLTPTPPPSCTAGSWTTGCNITANNWCALNTANCGSGWLDSPGVPVSCLNGKFSNVGTYCTRWDGKKRFTGSVSGCNLSCDCGAPCCSNLVVPSTIKAGNSFKISANVSSGTKTYLVYRRITGGAWTEMTKDAYGYYYAPSTPGQYQLNINTYNQNCTSVCNGFGDFYSTNGCPGTAYTKIGSGCGNCLAIMTVSPGSTPLPTRDPNPPSR